MDREAEYLAVILEPIRVCANYKPKMGQSSGSGIDLESFQSIYQADPFYSWFGLDNPLMYAAHKAAGGMTSIYRQIGIGCERLFRKILEHEFELGPGESSWSYEVPASDDRTRKLSLDGRIRLGAVEDHGLRSRVQQWIRDAANRIDVNERVRGALQGVVFEARQGYKSKDSKRQNADIANAGTAYSQGYLPCIILFSTQVDADIASRYRGEGWMVLVGTTAEQSPLVSTYGFMRDVVGYDLRGFFERNSQLLRSEIDAVLNKLLTPED